MKKIYSLLLLLTTLLTPFNALAALKVGDSFTTDGIRYKIISTNPRKVQVGPYQNGPAIDVSTAGTVNIPSSVEGSDGNAYSVTSIGHDAFRECKSVTSFVIPNTVERIYGSAFYQCSALTSIVIPNSVTKIDNSAFFNCYKLENVTIGNSVESIGDMVFGNCSKIKSLILPSSLKTIDNQGLAQMMGLEAITIPKSVTNIGSRVLYACPSLTSIIVENGNPNYDSRNNCNAIIHTVTNELIQGCSSSTIPYGITSIGDDAFGFNMSPGSINFPNTLTNIGEGAFSNIGGGSGLKFLFIPKSVKTIGNGAFNNQGDLISIVVEDGNTEFDTRDGCNALIRTSDNEMLRACYNSFIPNTVTAIGEGAFSSLGYYNNSPEFTSISIPNSVTAIGENAFMYCHQLEGVNLPILLKSIGSYAFYGCYKFTSITIPALVEEIGDRAFEGTDIKTVFSEINEPHEIGSVSDFGWRSSVFEDYDNTILYVPTGTKVKYKATGGWDKFKNIEEMALLDPIEGETTVNTEGLGGQDLTDNVMGDVYYNVGAGGYDSTDGSIVIGETTNMSEVGAGIPGTSEVANNFTGLILKVAAGKGTITVNAKTVGNAQLVVQVGNQTPMIATKTSQGDVVVSYDVAEDTYIYIYAIIGSSASRELRAASTDLVKIYGITVTPGATGIDATLMDDGELIMDNYYTLDGRKVQGMPKQKGVYIVNGRKVVIK